MSNLTLPNLTPAMIWAATYFIHSSLLLSSVWLWFRWREPTSHSLRETVWKLAAVGGLVTASLQLGLGIQSPVNHIVDAAWKATFNADSATPHAAKLAKATNTPRRQDAALLDTDAHAFSKQAQLIDDNAELALLDPAEWNLAADASPIRTQTVQDESDVLSSQSFQKATQQSQASVRPHSAWGAYFRLGITGLLAAVGGAIVALSGWGLLRLLSEQAVFRQRLKTCRVDAHGPARIALDGLLAEAKVRRPIRLMLDEQDLEPGACGWFQWQIVLPARAVEVLTPEELRGLLAHELAHLVRGDQWWLLVGRLLAVCFGWQPLNCIALREWQRASEYLCDAWAIQRQVPRLSLARCLTTVAEWRLVGLATVAGMGSGNLSNLSQRVERLVDDVPLTDPWQCYSRRHLIAAAGCLVAVMMVSLAPAATFPNRPQREAIKQANASIPDHAQDSNLSDADFSSTVPNDVGLSELHPSALLATEVDTAPPDVVVTIHTLAVVREQASEDLIQLQAELKLLQHVISQSPQWADHPLWQAQLQRFRQRMEKIQGLQNLLIVPL